MGFSVASSPLVPLFNDCQSAFLEVALASFARETWGKDALPRMSFHKDELGGDGWVWDGGQSWMGGAHICDIMHM